MLHALSKSQLRAVYHSYRNSYENPARLSDSNNNSNSASLHTEGQRSDVDWNPSFFSSYASILQLPLLFVFHWKIEQMVKQLCHLNVSIFIKTNKLIIGHVEWVNIYTNTIMYRYSISNFTRKKQFQAFSNVQQMWSFTQLRVIL